MKFRYRILGKSLRTKVREITRDSYVKTFGIPPKAKADAEIRIRESFTGWQMILVRVAIALAFALIEWWAERNIAWPYPNQFRAGEPGATK